MLRHPCKEILYEFEVTHKAYIFKNFWDVTTMNIDLPANKSDQVFNHKGLVRPCQIDPLSESQKQVDLLQSFNYLI